MKKIFQKKEMINSTQAKTIKKSADRIRSLFSLMLFPSHSLIRKNDLSPFFIQLMAFVDHVEHR